MAEWLAHSTAKQKVAGSNPTRASGWKMVEKHYTVKKNRMLVPVVKLTFAQFHG